VTTRTWNNDEVVIATGVTPGSGTVRLFLPVKGDAAMRPRHRTRTLGSSIIALLLALASALTLTTSTAEAAPACGITWGSLTKAAGSLLPTSQITGVRSGRHHCYDRLVVDLRGSLSGYSVSYVTTVLTEGGGFPVALRGGARLAVVVKAPTFDINTGQPTYSPADPRELTPVSGFHAFRQVADAGSLEGQTTIGLGVRARLPFRVFVLAGPGTGSRLVVDVAHHW